MWSTFPYYTALAKHLLCVNLSEEKVELGRISTNITKRRSYNKKKEITVICKTEPSKAFSLKRKKESSKNLPYKENP